MEVEHHVHDGSPWHQPGSRQRSLTRLRPSLTQAVSAQSGDDQPQINLHRNPSPQNLDIKS